MPGPDDHLHAPAGWYDDPGGGGGKRYWDGARWTEHTGPSQPQSPPLPQGPPREGGQPGGGFSGWITRKPLLAFWATLVVALLLGMGIGAASSTDTQLQDDLDQARSERESARDERDEAQSELADSGDRLEGATRRVKRLEKRLAAQEKQAPAAEKPPTPTPPPANPPSDGRTFSGNGSKNLGNIEVSTESVLEWTNDGDLFQIFDDDFGIGVNSQGHSGDTVLAPNTYRNVQVNALGNWTIKIRPR